MFGHHFNIADGIIDAITEPVYSLENTHSRIASKIIMPSGRSELGQTGTILKGVYHSMQAFSPNKTPVSILETFSL